MFYQPIISKGVFFLEPDESKHAIRVLRHRAGDIIHVTDGEGFLYEARILSEDQHQCTCEVITVTPSPLLSYSIHLAISPLNHPDRLEWFVEKAVELGVDRISIIICDRTEKRHTKPERLQKIAVGAMKQSQRLTLPLIEGPVPFSKFIQYSDADQKFIAYVDMNNPLHLINHARKSLRYVVLIGPEGDFTEGELNLALHGGFVKVSLGTHRLRTETAGIVACHVLNLINLS